MGLFDLIDVVVDGGRRLLEKVLDSQWVTGVMLQAVARAGRLDANILAALPRLLIVGEGGSGKSTLLKQFLARAAAGGKVPAWVSLAALPAEGPLTLAALIDHLVKEAHARLGIADVNAEFFEALVADGQLVIGFDGFDECATLPQRQRVRGLLVEVARTWSKCQMFVTSRPEVLRETPLPLAPIDAQPEPGQLIAVTPLPFGPADIAPFLGLMFDDGATLAQQLVGRTGIEALTATPLTLTLVGLVARTPKGLPATRTPLFARCLDTVCETWEEAKGPQPAPDGLDATQRLDVLRRLGWAAQAAGGDTLDADGARDAIAGAADRDVAARADRVLGGLARRNLLLRATIADDGSSQLASLRFSHPQFREYLAGAHLAEQLARDAAAAKAAMAPHWFDPRWLDVLRFAATVEDRPARRDALLAAALAAADPHHDLLRRPELLVAALLARLPQASDAIVTTVAGAVEGALAEPALRDEAARALLGLDRHPRAQAAIERFARGLGPAAAAFPLDDTLDDDTRLASLRWRLRAIEAHGRTRAAAAVVLLGELPSITLAGDLERCAVRRRLGDAAGARAEWRRLFDVAPEASRGLVGQAMDGAGEGPLFDAWLQGLLAAPDVTSRTAALAFERKLIAADDAVWSRLFQRAADALAALPPGEISAPAPVAEAIYTLADRVPAAATSPAGRALLEAGLRHPAQLWFVAPRVAKVLPALGAEAVERLVAYVVDSQRSPPGGRPDWSRLNGAVAALCAWPDDALAIPALLRLLREGDPADIAGPVCDSLLRRRQAGAAFDAIAPSLAPPAEATDAGFDARDAGSARRRAALWPLAMRLDRRRAIALADGWYRGGQPAADARRLTRLWDRTGLAAVARDWLQAVGADRGDARAQAFLHALTTPDRDTWLTDLARGTLAPPAAPAKDEPEPTREPWTADDYQRAFEFGLVNGWYGDAADCEETADARHLASLLSAIAGTSGPERALPLAEQLIERELAAHANVPDRARALADCLQELTTQGLRDPRWQVRAADLARAVPPADRTDLVAWLRANA